MFHPLLTHLLIAALIACPLWCGNGTCGASSGCDRPTVEPVGRGCETDPQADRCCGSEGSEESPGWPDSSNQPPAPCPLDGSCQGVCGGAVLESSHPIDDVPSSWAPLLIASVEVALDFLEPRRADRGPSIRWGPKNRGRVLRTLHMSMLC